MQTCPLLIVTLCLFLFTGCVTESPGPQKKKVDPEEVAEKLINLSIGYLRQHEYNRAKANLRKALELDPKSPIAHVTLGILFELEGESALAEEYFKKALRYDPDFSQARNNYGWFLFGQDRFEEAVEELIAATKDRFYSKRSQAFENLGIAYLRLENAMKAEQAFIRAVELNFSQSRALLELAIIRFDQKNFIESRRLYQRHSSVAQPSARSLGLCVQLARVFENKDQLASCGLLLKNIFPASDEYKRLTERPDDR